MKAEAASTGEMTSSRPGPPTTTNVERVKAEAATPGPQDQQASHYRGCVGRGGAAVTATGSSPINIRFEPIPEGYRVFKDDIFLVGIYKTKYHNTAAEGHAPMTGPEVKAHMTGAVVWQPLPKEARAVHWCDPFVPVPVLRAVVAALPEV